MTDYHSPTVVQPNIPAADITPLERLILGLVFDAESEDDGIYFHSWCGPSDIVTLSVDDLRAKARTGRRRILSETACKLPALWLRIHRRVQGGNAVEVY